MSDVRLVGTNPEDSSLVPVAVTAAGLLKTEIGTIEKIPNDLEVEGDLTITGDLIGSDGDSFKGPPGDKGDPGDPFQGNFDGDVVFTNGTVGIGAPASTKLQIFGEQCYIQNEGMAGYRFYNGGGLAEWFVGQTAQDNSDFTVRKLIGEYTADVLTIQHEWGKIGIATTEPVNTLHVNGNIQVENGQAFFSNCYYDSAWKSINGQLPNGYVNPCDPTGNLVLGTGPAGNEPQQRLVINSSGDCGIGTITPVSKLDVNGEVVIQSRGTKWRLVESNGLCHLVEVTQAADSESYELPEPPQLRDIPGELTMVETQLQRVLEKLRMIPEAGWEVWDGADEDVTTSDIDDLRLD